MILVALLLAAFAINLDTTMVNVALPSLVRELHATTTQLQWVVDAFNLAFAALLLTFGSLSDRFGRKGMLLAGVAASIVWSFAYFPLLETRIPSLVILASVVGMVCQASLWAPLAAFIPDMFESRVRCTGASLGFQLAGVFGGALAPSICIWLLDRFDNPLYISFYCAIGLATIALCVSKARTQQ